MSLTLTVLSVQHWQDLLNLSAEEIQKIRHPLFRAMAMALLEKQIDGDWYLVRNNPEIQDFDFAFLGFKRNPQLSLEGLWLKQCRKCGQTIPVLILRRTLYLRNPIPNKIDRYEEETECLVSRFTIECGEIYLDGFLALRDLIRKNPEGTPISQEEAFLDIKSKKKSLFILYSSKISSIGQ